jgi:hypothetical protein
MEFEPTTPTWQGFALPRPAALPIQCFDRKLSIRVRDCLALVTCNGVQNIGCETVPPPQRSQAMAPTVTG